MNTSHGWARAQLRLKGIEPDYNSLREAYLIAALRKENRINFKNEVAKIVGAAGGKVEEALKKYVEEMFPEVAEKREEFMENNKMILEDLAGNEIDLSQYQRMDN